jgi:hypothetical protein
MFSPSGSNQLRGGGGGFLRDQQTSKVQKLQPLVLTPCFVVAARFQGIIPQNEYDLRTIFLHCIHFVDDPSMLGLQHSSLHRQIECFAASEQWGVAVVRPILSGLYGKYAIRKSTIATIALFPQTTIRRPALLGMLHKLHNEGNFIW